MSLFVNLTKLGKILFSSHQAAANIWSILSISSTAYTFFSHIKTLSQEGKNVAILSQFKNISEELEESNSFFDLPRIKNLRIKIKFVYEELNKDTSQKELKEKIVIMPVFEGYQNILIRYSLGDWNPEDQDLIDEMEQFIRIYYNVDIEKQVILDDLNKQVEENNIEDAEQIKLMAEAAVENSKSK